MPDAPADPDGTQPSRPATRARRERRSMLLRLDPEVHEALARWAADELRSTNAHVEFLLRQAVHRANRLRDAPAPGTAAGAGADEHDAGAAPGNGRGRAGRS